MPGHLKQVFHIGEGTGQAVSLLHWVGGCRFQGRHEFNDECVFHIGRHLLVVVVQIQEELGQQNGSFKGKVAADSYGICR